MVREVRIFEFEGHQVRFVGTFYEPEWIAQDVCDALEVAEARSSLRQFNDDEKSSCIVQTLGGQQTMLTVKEPGFYRLIFKSRKEVAERFRHWVFHNVLPSIRKTGSYSVLPASTDEIQESSEFSEISQTFANFYFSSPPYLGSIDNPITASNITPEIRNGYGWKGNEKLMSDLLIELISYRGAYILRESPHRSSSYTEKQKSKRIDLILRLDEYPGTIFVYEIKPDYIDCYDVNDTFGSKAYLEILLRDLCSRGLKYERVVGCFVSPGGITVEALQAMRRLQQHLNQIANSGKALTEELEVKLNSLLLCEFVRDELYPVIVGRHHDNKGNFGTGFIDNTIDPLCEKLINPDPWIQQLKASFRALKKANLKENLLNPSTAITLDLIAEAEKIGVQLNEDK